MGNENKKVIGDELEVSERLKRLGSSLQRVGLMKEN